MSMKNQLQNDLILWLRSVVRNLLFAVALMWSAGTIRWIEAWVIIGLWSIFGFAMTVYLMHRDPELLAERLKLVPIQKEQKTWDKLLMLMFFIFGIGLYIIPGFDVMRYGWSEPLPTWIEVIAMLVHFPCFVFLTWVLRENTYLSQVVKIDEERGHSVITTGPYALVRHPMYTAVIILLFAFPLALGSRYSLLLSMILTVLLVVRTYYEDKTLHEELEGYPEYAKKTPYRLLPGVW